MSIYRAPCPRVLRVRSRVGTAHDGLASVEGQCTRLCPPYDPRTVLLIELNLGFAEPDRIRRCHRDRSVDAEDRELELVAGADLGAQHHAVGHVVALHGGRARVAAAARDIAV